MPVSRDTSGGSLVFGCVPDTDDATTRLLLADICKELSRLAGERILPHRAPSPEALASAFATGRVQIAWVSPTLLLTAPELQDAIPLVNSVREKIAAYHGVVFVREDAPYRSAVDLKGTRAAWVAASSAAGYIFPRLALASYGLDPRTFFVDEQFVGSHGNVARAVLTGRADVGGVYAVFEQGNPMLRLLRAAFLDAVPGRHGRILFSTAAIPSDLIVVARTVSPTTRVALAQALESIHENDAARVPIQRVLGAEAFIRHDPATLATLRDQVDTGRQLGLLD